MADLLQRLKQRKLVQWAVAYVAGAWVVLQVLDMVSGSYHWPDAVMHIAFGVLALGFVVVLVLAWYHGERGAQRVSGPELLLIALALAIGGGVLWNFARAPSNATASQAIASTSRPDAAQRNPGPRLPLVPDSAATAVASGLRVASVPIAAQPIPAKSVAVLPFESLSSDKNNAYFADGMQDLILTKLADIGDLKVIARTSTMQYGSHPQNLTLVGQQLGVATILEGSVQKAGKQVLINVQLIDVNTDSHIWAQSYQRTLDNIFGVEGEVAEKVATALNAKLTAQETAAVNRIPTTNPQAYVLYLKAQHAGVGEAATESAQRAAMRKSADELRQAIALDPNFADAYARLAFWEYFLTPPDKRVATQPWMTHARKALSLQPDSPGALLTIGRWQFDHGQPGPGLQALQKAARLAPNLDVVTANLTSAYKQLGAWQKADATAHQAVRVNPRDSVDYFVAALTSKALGHYTDARQMLELGLAVSPHVSFMHRAMGDMLVLLGDFAGARAQYAQLPAGSVYGKFVGLAEAWLLSRNCTEAIKAARHMPSPPEDVEDTGHRETLIGRCELEQGDRVGGQATLGKARAAIQAALKKHPQHREEFRVQASLQAQLATIEAWLNQRDAAVQANDAAIALATRVYTTLHKQSGLPSPPDGARISAAGYYERKAETLAHFDDAKGATDILRWLFQAQSAGTGGHISPALLRLDPAWDPIRHDPTFQALMKKYGTTSPADASTAVPKTNP